MSLYSKPVMSDLDIETLKKQIRKALQEIQGLYHEPSASPSDYEAYRKCEEIILKNIPILRM